jgi:cytochrome P450
MARAANGPLTDWRIAGVQLNPLRLMARHISARAAGVDRALPYEHLFALTALSFGTHEYQRYLLGRWAPLGDANRERARRARVEGRSLPPHTPDGDTVAMTTPAPPLFRFPDDLAVDTVWNKIFDGPLAPLYLTRSRHVMRHTLDGTTTTDRGPMPYYYFQQFLGQRGVRSCPGRHAAGLFAGQLCNNATWSEDRVLARDMFGLATVDMFTPGMSGALAEVSGMLDESIARDPEAVIDANVMMSKIAYTMIIRAVFGDVDLAEFHALGDAMAHSSRALLAYAYEFTMGRRKLPDDYRARLEEVRNSAWRFITLLRELDERDQLTEHQRAIPSVKLALESNASKESFERLGTLFLPLILAGHETTGHTMAWALYELARNPQLEAQVVAEIDAYQAAHHGQPLTTVDYDERPFGFALLAEILRLHPPVSGTPRTAQRAGTIPPDPETGIGGFSYPAGTMFVHSLIGTHYDPRRWPEPTAFRVERFFDGIEPGMPLREQGRAVRRNIRAREEAFDFIPFAAGPGRCVGQHFNAHEFLLVLDALVGRYRFELEHPERDVPHSEEIILGPAKGTVGVRIRHRAPRAPVR